jgi:hypothetical protein
MQMQSDDSARQVEAIQSVSAVTQINATSRINFSILHLMAATRLSRAAGAIEKEHQGEPHGDFAEDIRSFATACVLTSVAAMEAYINEVFADHATMFPKIPPADLDEFWKGFERRGKILEKFNLALILVGGRIMDKDMPPRQGAEALIKLRNALTHFKPEWENEQKEHENLSKHLRCYIKPSPFFGGTGSLFPRLWASHSCTKWTVKTTIAFLSEFEKLGSIKPRMGDLLTRLPAEGF